VRLRDPRLVQDAMFELGEIARPGDSHIPELTARLNQWARELNSRPISEGNARVRIVVGEEHDRYPLAARDTAKTTITVLSHRLGVVAKPAILIPVRDRSRFSCTTAKAVVRLSPGMRVRCKEPSESKALIC
jgi:hypothetical protein